MMIKGPNHSFVVWAVCILWILSIFTIFWSLLLFFCVGEILMITNTDLVNAFMLLSGIITLPTIVYMLCSIANNRQIDYKAKVLCCPLWLCMIWIIIINIAAAIVCISKICVCTDWTNKYLHDSMKRYRSVPKYKHFLDNLQWSLKCCGLQSYQDWFSHDWYDKIRDYEWNPLDKRSIHMKRSSFVMDSVPLSCCKSGSCISNYLTELGTNSINTCGCAPIMYRIVMISMNVHLVLFIVLVILEIIILKMITKKDIKDEQNDYTKNKTDVRHIMTVKNNFEVSSGSYQLNPEDSDDMEASIHDYIKIND